MTDDLSGKHALVTGGGSGIGLAIAGMLASRGARVTIVGRNLERLQAARDSLAAAGPVHAITGDVGEAASVDAIFAQARDTQGPVDILVNNAGISLSAPFEQTGLEELQRMFSVNVGGTFLCCRAALPDMRKRNWGRIVNVASVAGLEGYPLIAAYCASKHAVVGLTRALAREVIRTGITVNALCPGYSDTEMTAAAIAGVAERSGKSEQDSLAALLRQNPQRRLIEPAEVAAAAAWLCGPGSQSITGQAIPIAGGEIMR